MSSKYRIVSYVNSTTGETYYTPQRMVKVLWLIPAWVDIGGLSYSIKEQAKDRIDNYKKAKNHKPEIIKYE